MRREATFGRFVLRPGNTAAPLYMAQAVFARLTNAPECPCQALRRNRRGHAQGDDGAQPDAAIRRGVTFLEEPREFRDEIPFPC